MKPEEILERELKKLKEYCEGNPDFVRELVKVLEREYAKGYNMGYKDGYDALVLGEEEGK